jgi:tRNA(Ile)-lysidine synthase
MLVGASGGADSLALLVSLKRLGVSVQALCLDHGLRAESPREVAFVQTVAQAWAIPFHTRQLRLSKGSGLEAAARDARYAALEAVRVELGLDYVATGHTASDQAETLLMRLGRGTALGGAASILERRGDRVLRPLLEVSRAQTLAYVAALGLEPVRDPMNEDLAFTRVRVRLEVLPALVNATGPGTERALARFAALAHDDDAYLMEEARTGLARAATPHGLDRVALLSLPLPIRRRALALFFEVAAIPVETQLVEQSLAAIERESNAPLPLDLQLTVQRGELTIEPAKPRRS